MKNIKQFFSKNSKTLGAILVVVGVILHLIPLFPAGWIIFIGLELAGFRLLLRNKNTTIKKGGETR